MTEMNNDKKLGLLMMLRQKIPVIDDYQLISKHRDERDFSREKLVLLANDNPKYIVKVFPRPKNSKISPSVINEAYSSFFMLNSRDSPNIARMLYFDFGDSCQNIDIGKLTREKSPVCDYLVYEYIEGKTLIDYIQQEATDDDLILIVYKIIKIIYDTHEFDNFNHGNLTPDNIMIKPDKTPVLINFSESTFDKSERIIHDLSFLISIIRDEFRFGNQRFSGLTESTIEQIYDLLMEYFNDNRNEVEEIFMKKVNDLVATYFAERLKDQI